MLRVEGLEVSYGELKALWGISFEVEEGEIVSIIGPNGAGKTTTLKTIVGILKADKGTIEFDGVRLNDLPTHERIKLGLTLVPEGGEIFPYLTVQENLEIGAYLPEARKKFKENIDYVFSLFPRLKERRKQMAGPLSGAERQMPATGRAQCTWASMAPGTGVYHRGPDSQRGAWESYVNSITKGSDQPVPGRDCRRHAARLWPCPPIRRRGARGRHRR